MALAQEIRESDVALEPRGLLDNTTFDKIVSCIVKDKKVIPEYAAEMFGQTLVFLKAHADSLRSTPPGLPLPDGKRYRVVPEATVDEGRHAFLQFTEDYTAFCERIAGTYLHHRPVMTKEMAEEGDRGDSSGDVREPAGRHPGVQRHLRRERCDLSSG